MTDKKPDDPRQTYTRIDPPPSKPWPDRPRGSKPHDLDHSPGDTQPASDHHGDHKPVDSRED